MESKILEFRNSGYGTIIVKYQACQVTYGGCNLLLEFVAENLALEIEEFQADKSRDKTDTTGTPPLTRFFGTQKNRVKRKPTL